MKLACWTVVAALTVVAGCADPVAPTSSTRIGASLVRLSVSASASEVARGSPVNFQITLVNEGSEAVTLHFRDTCQINPYIRNRFGKVVLPGSGGWICAAMLTDLTLMPGQIVARDFVWTGSTSFRSEDPLHPLPAGKYFFTAEVPSSEATLRATVKITLK